MGVGCLGFQGADAGSLAGRPIGECAVTEGWDGLLGS